MSETFILAVDQGTSATKTVVFDTQGCIVAKAAQPLKSYFPQPGFVEQDPLEIFIHYGLTAPGLTKTAITLLESNTKG